MFVSPQTSFIAGSYTSSQHGGHLPRTTMAALAHSLARSLRWAPLVSVFPLPSIKVADEYLSARSIPGSCVAFQLPPRASQHAGTRPRHMSQCQPPPVTHVLHTRTLCTPDIYTTKTTPHTSLPHAALIPHTAHNAHSLHIAHTAHTYLVYLT